MKAQEHRNFPEGKQFISIKQHLFSSYICLFYRVGEEKIRMKGSIAMGRGSYGGYSTLS